MSSNNHEGFNRHLDQGHDLREQNRNEPDRFIPERHATGTSRVMPDSIYRLLDRGVSERRETYLRDYIRQQISECTLNANDLLNLRSHRTTDESTRALNIDRKDIANALFTYTEYYANDLKPRTDPQYTDAIDRNVRMAREAKENTSEIIINGFRIRRTTPEQRNSAIARMIHCLERIHEYENISPAPPQEYVGMPSAPAYDENRIENS